MFLQKCGYVNTDDNKTKQKSLTDKDALIVYSKIPCINEQKFVRLYDKKDNTDLEKHMRKK